MYETTVSNDFVFNNSNICFIKASKINVFLVPFYYSNKIAKKRGG